MKTKMNWCLCLLLTLLVSNGFAQTEQDEYMKVITERSDKIIAELGILDSIAYYQARALVVNQYAAINAHHEAREAEIKKIKEKFAGQEALLDQTRAAYEAEEDARLRVLHAEFIKKLEEVLEPIQIEGVKNGMTYGVLPLTYRAFQEMIPTLTSEEKAWILLWLRKHVNWLWTRQTRRENIRFLVNIKDVLITTYLNGGTICKKKVMHGKRAGKKRKQELSKVSN